MNQKGYMGRAFHMIMVAALGLAIAPKAGAQILFDAGLGTKPEAQGWFYADAGGVTPTEALVNNSILLDTTASSLTEAGWSEITAADLNRTNTFTLAFSLQLNAETHTSTNRSGFSLIVLGDDKSGIELSFWTGTVFALSDSPLFVHAEEINFATTGTFINYALTLRATNYVLQANGTPILAGFVRNYTAFTGAPNPYETPNYLFFGDNTTAAAASFNLRQVALVFPPKLTMPAPGVLAWTGIRQQTYAIQASTNLVTWITVGTATSASGSFAFTNSPALAAQFLRVAYPAGD